MLLIELLEVISESANIEVYNTNWELLTEYNGRDNIDKKYNNCKVVYIFPHSNECIRVQIITE